MNLNTVNNLTRFFNGESLANIFSNQAINEQNKTIFDIYNYDDRLIEDDHSFIQWIFPTPRASAFNRNAPVLTMNDISILRNNREIIRWLNLFKDKMFKYWGLTPKNTIQAHLLNGHNGLRFSRAIECLTLFGIEVGDIFTTVRELINIGVIRPSFDYYKGDYLPLWFIRYKESSEMLTKLHE